MAGVFLTQRNAAAEQSKFDGITADGSARLLDFSTLDKTQYHKPLNLLIREINRLDDGLSPRRQRREGVSVCFQCFSRWLKAQSWNDNYSHYDVQ